MKTRALFLLAALLSLATAAWGSDGLMLSEASVKPGDEADITVSLSQQSGICTGFQFDLELADGLQLVANSNGTLFTFASQQDNDPACDVQSLGGSSYRFVVYSNALQPFTNGAVLSLRVKAGSGMASGDYLLTMRNVILSDSEGNTTKLDDRDFHVRVVTDYLEESVMLESLAINCGETKDVGLSLVQELERYTGLQFDITLPDGLTLETGTDGKTYTFSGTQDNDPSCDMQPLGGNAYRFVIYSNSLKPFHNGLIMSLHVKAGSTMEPGNYTITLSNIALSDADGNVTKFSNQSSAVRVIGRYTLTYMVDGTMYKQYQLEYGATITPEPAPTKEGYTFSGWSEVPTTMPAHDVTVTGTFTVNKYKLIYLLDGEKYKTFDVEYGTVIIPEPDPVKEGYTFSGWSEIPETMPAYPVFVKGTFTINKYKLTYMVDGIVYKSYELEYETSIIPEPAPAKEGYTFSGWSEIPATMPANDVTVTGSFTVNSYKLTYILDGTVYKTYVLEYGAPITPEPAPEPKEGYTFSGWSEIPATMPAHDVTVTGIFTINKYKLTYMVDGEVYKSYEMEYGAAITPEPAPTKEGYTFSGWSEIPATMPAHDVTVTGTFTINKYKLTYLLDDQIYKVYDVEYGAKITPEPAPTKEGYTFSGWSKIPSTMPAHDVTVMGTFTVNQYKLTYLVDSEEYRSYELEYGATIIPEPAPTKEGYTFSGWSEIPATMPAHDVTVTGSFTVNTYKLTYLVNGEVYKSYELEYGTVITPEPAPEKEGYTFSGWSWIPTRMPAEDVTVTGTFSINRYRLTYMIDNVVYKEVLYDYGATITPEPQPEGEYARFEWVGLPETMPAHDVTVYASYETGIVDVQMLQGIKGIYTPNGKKLDMLQKGLNIVVMNDGRKIKVVVK